MLIEQGAISAGFLCPLTDDNALKASRLLIYVDASFPTTPEDLRAGLFQVSEALAQLKK